jgi:hypothetical protein
MPLEKRTKNQESRGKTKSYEFGVMSQAIGTIPDYNINGFFLRVTNGIPL